VQEVLATTDGLWIRRKVQKPAPGVPALKSRLKILIKAAQAAVSNKAKGTGTGGKNAKEDWMELALEIQQRRDEATLQSAGAKRAATQAAARRGAAGNGMVQRALGLQGPAKQRHSTAEVDPATGLLMAPVRAPARPPGPPLRPDSPHVCSGAPH
jgi:hypothetical protein